MNWLFLIASLLFLAFSLEWIPGRPSHGRYALVWQWNHFRLIRLMPKNLVFLIDGDVAYQYVGGASGETYIPAVELSSGLQKNILHYLYLLDWIREPPVVMTYPEDVKDHVLNYLTDNLKLGKESEP